MASATCGYAYRVERSLMNTEAGKIQGNLHTWGIAEVQNHKVPWGNYDVKDTDGQVPQVGTPEYKDYMKAMIAAHGDQYPTELQMVPQPTVEEIEKDPKLAGFTYQRQQCQRCHVGVKGREKRGDYRGMGCSSCHIPYGNEGYYEGNDPTIDKEQKGHLLTHKIQATRKTKIKHGDVESSGYPGRELQLLPQPRQAYRRDLPGPDGIPLRFALQRRWRQAAEAAYQAVPVHLRRPASPDRVASGEPEGRPAVPGLPYHHRHAR